MTLDSCDKITRQTEARGGVMQRHWELIQTILALTERHLVPGNTLRLTPESVPGYDQNVINEHVRLCAQAGLLEYQSTLGGPNIQGLTFFGHNVLDRVRAGQSISTLVG